MLFILFSHCVHMNASSSVHKYKSILKQLYKRCQFDHQCQWTVPRKWQSFFSCFKMYTFCYCIRAINWLSIVWLAKTLVKNDLNVMLFSLCPLNGWICAYDIRTVSLFRVLHCWERENSDHQTIVTTFYFYLRYIYHMMYDSKMYKKSNCERNEFI